MQPQPWPEWLWLWLWLWPLWRQDEPAQHEQALLSLPLPSATITELGDTIIQIRLRFRELLLELAHDLIVAPFTRALYRRRLRRLLGDLLMRLQPLADHAGIGNIALLPIDLVPMYPERMSVLAMRAVDDCRQKVKVTLPI